MKANVRENYFKNMGDSKEYMDLSGSFSLKWNFTRALAVEGTFDRLVQYYHTLEGLPVGWSLDMVVPSGEVVRPDTAMQGNIGLSMNLGRHRASVGGFYKTMDNLVYYRYAQTLFSGGMSKWEEDVDQGQGLSYGGEFLYEYQGSSLYARASYTLSRTDRSGFPSINDGGVFHARFDRTHILNLLARWKGFSAAFTFQSGHWENGASIKYPMHIIGGSEWTADYWSGVNNYHMPDVLRLDLGYQFSFVIGRVSHDVNLGICNVTNHFNPFMLYFDATTESWKALALLPILPNFSLLLARGALLLARGAIAALEKVDTGR